jgi:small subunit ribosomal protein S7
MSRKGSFPRRAVLPDPVYHSKLVTRAINFIMLRGQRGTAQVILYNAFKRVEKATNRNPLEVFTEAFENVKPRLEVISFKRGGQNTQRPVEIRPERQETLSLRWLINYARQRKDKTMEEKLAKEIIEASNKAGGAIKKREDIHKMAEANKAFANIRW